MDDLVESFINYLSINSPNSHCRHTNPPLRKKQKTINAFKVFIILYQVYHSFTGRGYFVVETRAFHNTCMVCVHLTAEPVASSRSSIWK